MELSDSLLLVLAAALLDGLLGDPVYRWHPIRLLGGWISRCELALFALGLSGYLGGVLHWLLVVGGALGLWWLIHALLGGLHPWLGAGWDLFIAYSLLCTRDLLDAGERVLAALDDPPRARAQLAMLVGRDTEPLDRAGMVRAVIESLSENLTDGVLTPLWAFCLFGLPGLIVVKAISSLDSMVGYKTPRYRRFGWAGARSDDLIHWLPARLSVPLIMAAAWLLGEHPRAAWHAAWRHHAMLPSPNSGWSEAACAGALQVRLVGPIHYQGQLISQQYMGESEWPAALDASHLRRALRLIGTSALLAFGAGVAFIGL